MTPTMPPTELRDLLQTLRQQVLAGGPEAFHQPAGGRLSFHQLGAHLSIAYACGEAPEAWELYRAAWPYLLPRTTFYERYAAEILEALRPAATWELLHQHAVLKAQLEASMTEAECKLFSYPGLVQYYDAASHGWRQVDVPAVRWSDGREIVRVSLLQRQDVMEGPHASQLRVWLDKLDATPDFLRSVFTVQRRAENEVRAAMGIPAVGEGLVSEPELLYRVRKLLPGVEVIEHARLPWLGQQHLDIFIPSRQLAVEFHGFMHFHPVEHFGGAVGLERRQVLDERKRKACARNGVRLVEVAYDRPLDDADLQALLEGPA